MADRGRPRTFDRQSAVNAAMRLFWERGYEAVSLSDLTGAMGIRSSSLYVAFGSKEALFREAVKSYVAGEADATAAVLAAGDTARIAIRALLDRAAGRVAREGEPLGCLVMLGVIHHAPENDHIAAYLVAQREVAGRAIHGRILRGIADGDVPGTADVDGLAAFYVAILRALSLSARDGAKQPELAGIVDRAMAAWDA
ncbi:MAG: TetR/AcrR family transcriptional regulator [Pseudomonadota bacterium]|jgi:AcrR family transcriptional regulator